MSITIMTFVAIPAWTAQGVLPPVNPANPVSNLDRSPYIVSLTDVVLRFNTSLKRRAIIDGLLRYRAALHAVGLIAGFQWLDGSFMEDVEILEGRPPRDIDVVTFYQLPADTSQADILKQNQRLFDRGNVKSTYHVDGYNVSLGTQPDQLARRSAYWYGVWSHRRNDHWKGFLEIGLAPDHDAEALASLNASGEPS